MNTVKIFVVGFRVVHFSNLFNSLNHAILNDMVLLRFSTIYCTMSKAFIFDLNGTMIDDMQFHVKAWYHILNDELGAGMNWEQVKSHMYGKNAELLIRVFGKEKFSIDEMNAISLEKEKRYQQEYRPHL